MTIRKYIALAVIPCGVTAFVMNKFKSYIIVGAVAFALGALLAALLSARYHKRHAEVIVQTDTVVVFDTLRYGKDEIKTEVDKSKKPRVEYVYVKLPPEVVEKVVHDTTYVEKEIPLRKEHYYSEADDVRIWHSGVTSAIDSVENVRRTQIVTNVTTKDIKHTLGVYANMGYCKGLSTPVGEDANMGYSNGLSTPVGVRYTYYPKRWLGVGVRAEHDLAQDRVSVLGTLELSLGF